MDQLWYKSSIWGKVYVRQTALDRNIHDCQARFLVLLTRVGSTGPRCEDIKVRDTKITIEARLTQIISDGAS